MANNLTSYNRFTTLPNNISKFGQTLEEIERGEEPYKAALRSRLNQLAFGLTDEDFYHHYFG